MSDPSLAERFNVELGVERVEGAISYRVELSAPEGGSQAIQQVRLVPQGGGTPIIAGAVHPAQRWAELRTFEHLKLLHAQRHQGAEIPLDRGQYDQLLDKLRAFFAGQQCAVRAAALPEAAAGPSGTLVLLVIFLAALATAASVTWYLTHR